MIVLLNIAHNIVQMDVYNIACHIVHIAQVERVRFVVHIARNCTTMLEIVHKIVLVPFADVDSLALPGAGGPQAGQALARPCGPLCLNPPGLPGP